eukprot:6476675-Pyramimonas_sp.AAC.1
MQAQAAQSHGHAHATLRQLQQQCRTCAHMPHTFRCTVRCKVQEKYESINAHAGTCRRVADTEKEGGTNKEKCHRRDE